MANDGQAALELLDEIEGNVDLIICDWIMPRLSGLEFLQQVRAKYPDVPFMMATANTNVESVVAAKQYGANAFIAKPYSARKLGEKLLDLVSGL